MLICITLQKNALRTKAPIAFQSEGFGLQSIKRAILRGDYDSSAPLLSYLHTSGLAR